MDKELKQLLDLAMQVTGEDKKESISPDCVLFAHMTMGNGSISVEVGNGTLINEVLEEEFGKAYTETLHKTAKQLSAVLREFAYRIDRLGREKALSRQDGGRYA